ncbi:energy-coupling factor transporter transmembrane protein EcfT [Breznakia sp. OttesenSCG-928-G09]|nr:energy-coupling factor transporter transmembrane protein EcfT [Breznakia sp. OttesenSCG-928-G09]
MGDMVLGRYLPLDSILHRMDPRAKIICMLFLLIAIFIPAGYLGYVILGGLVISLILLSKLKITYILKAMKPMMFMLVFLLIINILVIKSGNLLLSLGWFEVYDDAIFQTLFIVVRLALMISITTLLTATTKPLDLTLGIEDLLTPFKRIGVPAHIIAMMISIALRFIPTLIEETQRIMKAQASRGVDFEEGKFTEKIRGILSLIVPLFISAFQRAEDLAYAMEARGYAPDEERTRYKQLKLTGMDIMSMLLCFAVLMGLIGYIVL